MNGHGALEEHDGVWRKMSRATATDVDQSCGGAVIDLEEKSYFDEVQERGIGIDDEDDDDNDDEDVTGEVLDLNNLPHEFFVKILVLGDLGVGKTSLLEAYVGDDHTCQVSSPDCSCSSLDRSANKTDYRVSVDVGYHLKKLDICSNRKATIQLWDVPGHERYSGMSRVYYKYAHGALIVFDLARPETFESALGWLSDVTEKLFDEKFESVAEQSVRVRRSHGGPPPSSGSQAPPTSGLDSSSSSSAMAMAMATGSNRPMPVILLANKRDVPMVKVARNKYSSYVTENGLLAWYETCSRDVSTFAHSVRTLVEYILETDPAFVDQDHAASQQHSSPSDND